MDEQTAKSIDYTQKLWDALNRIDSVAVTLPTFEVIHEGDMDAVVENIVIAISKAAAALSQPAAAEPLTDDRILEISDWFNTGRAQGALDFARAIEAQHGIAKATP